MMFWFVWGCISSHHILTLSDGADEEDKKKNVVELVQILNKAVSPQHLFLVAEAAGKLKYPNEDLEKKIANILYNNSLRPEIRAEAAWALGEIGRTSGRVYFLLVKATETETHDLVIRHLLEALAKVYGSTNHSTEEDLIFVRALDALSERTGYKSPFFQYLHRSVESIEVLSILLLEAIETKMHINKPDQYYLILLNFLDFLLDHEVTIIHQFSEHKALFSKVFSAILKDGDMQQTESVILSLWFLVLLSKEPQMADVTGSALLQLETTNPDISALVHIHLTQLLTNVQVREYFRDVGLKRIENEDVLTFLANQYHRRDFVQYLYERTSVP